MENAKIIKHVGCGYLESVLLNWEEVIDSLVIAIRKSGVSFDSIAFRGMSGALVAPAVAGRLGKDMLMIRKDDKSHSTYPLEGNVAISTYIIIDDLIASGDTMKAIIDRISNDIPGSKCLGIALYCPQYGSYSTQFNNIPIFCA